MTDVEQPQKVSPAAERMRRYRARRSKALSCVMIQLREKEIFGLIQCGLLEPSQRQDRAAIAAALHKYLDRNPILGRKW
jgi:hypothetical protein